MHALQRDHGELLQPIPGQVRVGHGQQRTGEAPLPQQAKSALGLRRPGLGATVLVTEQLLQGRTGSRVRGWRAWSRAGAGPTGEPLLEQGQGGSPSLGSHLSVGGQQDFWLSIQIDIGDQATEDTVELVASR